MAGRGHRALTAGLLVLAVTLLLFGTFMVLVTARELARADYGGALVGTAVSALPAWGGVRLVRLARRRGRKPIRSGCSDTWAQAGAHSRRQAGRPVSRGRRIVRICCAVPLLLGSAFLLAGAALSLVHGEDGRLTGLFAGLGVLAGQYALRLTGILRPSRGSGGDGSGGGSYGCGAGCGSGGGCGSAG